MLACPECKSPDLRKFGTKFVRSNGEKPRIRKQQYICKKCGRITVKPILAPNRDSKGRFVKSDTLTEVSKPSN